MFDYHQKATGTQYTAPVALATMAGVFSPAVLVLSRPTGYVSFLAAFAGSMVCAALAWLNWKKYSRLTIPSIEPLFAVSK